jgi:hypothetical protein
MRIGAISRCTPSTKTAVFACIGSGNEPHGLALPKVHTSPTLRSWTGPLCRVVFPKTLSNAPVASWGDLAHDERLTSRPGAYGRSAGKVTPAPLRMDSTAAAI